MVEIGRHTAKCDGNGCDAENASPKGQSQDFLGTAMVRVLLQKKALNSQYVQGHYERGYEVWILRDGSKRKYHNQWKIRFP